MINLKVAKNKPKTLQRGAHVSAKAGTNTRAGIVLEDVRPLLLHTGIEEIIEIESAATITIVVTANRIVEAQTESKLPFILTIFLDAAMKE
jgi:hypothetical protein